MIKNLLAAAPALLLGSVTVPSVVAHAPIDRDLAAAAGSLRASRPTAARRRTAQPQNGPFNVDQKMISEAKESNTRMQVQNVSNGTTARQNIITATLGVLFTAFTAFASAAPASAATPPSEVPVSVATQQGRPTGCSYDLLGDWGAEAKCTNPNGGSYQALVNCKDPDSGRVYVFEGLWERGVTSRAYCEGNTRAIAAGIGTRVS
ncbi:hypothetical protein ACHZ98_29195 [Streptomyces sp. MAR4 CNY-716]